MRQQLVQAPVELVVANHAMGLWELAALHLSHKPPQLPQAQLAIDALSALLDGLQGRLGGDEQSLRDGLAEIRLAFVQIHNAERPVRATKAPSPTGRRCSRHPRQWPGRPEVRPGRGAARSAPPQPGRRSRSWRRSG